METIVLFTDTHFGVKNNSMTWLNSQLDFIYKQLIPDLKKMKEEMDPIRDQLTLIHLGDVFDSRSTISTYVATKVREAFSDLKQVVDQFNIVAGNHDFYSPNSDEVCSIDLLLNELNINLFTRDSYLTNNGDLFLPWYQYQDTESVNQLIKQGKVDRIFTHADIVTEKVPYIGIPIYSGHLHIPDINPEINRFNLGSCYALDFADSNNHRGYYVLKEDQFKFIPNIQSIRFWRLHDEEIFDECYNHYIKTRDYVELYISESNMSDPRYIEKLNFFTQTYKNIWIIPQTYLGSNYELEKFEGYDIEKITKKMIPTELQHKFEVVLNSCNKSLIMKNE